MIRDEIIRKIREHEKEIQDLGAERLSLFGSAVRDDLLPESDIDILVSFVMPADYRRYINLKFFLEDLLQRPVDLVMETALKPRIRKRVEREMIRVA
ncbi:MAG TPA: nucleotidyltransferase family protein [Synergistales bacterium]|nr:nucleotidyltransferase family protein [Synergistales bacterium]HQO83750.1 nucleotidyltransferase family protein [Synergistales bacterium]HQQ09965.1 nucleotidyltransferase family protein [Synergistales bacterium]